MLTTILSSWKQQDYQQIYSLPVDTLLKFADDVDYTTIYLRIQRFKPTGKTFDVYYCPVGSPEYAEYGYNTIKIIKNETTP